MRVRIDRALELRVGRVAFAVGPAEIAPRDALVDLLEGCFADVVDVHQARARLDVKRVGIAQTVRPDGPVDAGCLVQERVVRRDRAVGVDAEDLAERVRQRLRVAERLVVADGDVELSVGAELERGGGVDGVHRVGQVEHVHLAAGHGDVAVQRESADAIVGRRGRRSADGVRDVDELVGREVRIKSEAEEAAFDLVDGRDGQGRRRQEGAVLDDPDVAALFEDEDPAVGRPPAPFERVRSRRSFVKPVGSTTPVAVSLSRMVAATVEDCPASRAGRVAQRQIEVSFPSTACRRGSRR